MFLRSQDLVHKFHQTQEYTNTKKSFASFLLKQRLVLSKPKLCERLFSQIIMKT